MQGPTVLSASGLLHRRATLSPESRISMDRRVKPCSDPVDLRQNPFGSAPLRYEHDRGLARREIS